MNHPFPRNANVLSSSSSAKSVLICLIILPIQFLFLSTTCYAETYKWVDQSGTFHLTDNASTIPVKYRKKALADAAAENMESTVQEFTTDTAKTSVKKPAPSPVPATSAGWSSNIKGDCQKGKTYTSSEYTQVQAHHYRLLQECDSWIRQRDALKKRSSAEAEISRLEAKITACVKDRDEASAQRDLYLKCARDSGLPLSY